MKKIRNDIFPNISPYIGEKEELFKILNAPKEAEEEFLKQYISRYRGAKIKEFMDEVYSAMDSQFSSKKELVDYINAMNDAETAELFIRICKFYFISKKFQPTSYVKLIMMFSIIEKTISKEKEYEEFHSWIFNQRSLIQEGLDNAEKKDKKTFLKIIEKLKDEYFKQFGSQRNVLEFFKNYVTTYNQIKLIKAFKANYTDVIKILNPKTLFYYPFQKA